MYNQEEIQDGLKFFLEYYEQNSDIEFQELYLYLVTELCKNINKENVPQFLENI